MAELMKGNTWGDRCDAVDRKGNPIVTYPVYVEDKHDEIRCHVQVCGSTGAVQYLSYAGKPLANMVRFDMMFETLARGTGHTEFDMGFEVNGNFNDSYRWVRSTKGIPEDLKNAECKFYVFGLPNAGDTLRNQLLWRNEVAAYAQDWCATPVAVPEVVLCDNAHDVENAFLNARARGLEGVMVKQPGALYERKRTDGWLKLKPEEDADGVIVELLEATATVDDPERAVRVGDPLGRVGSVRVRMQDGSEACPHGIGHELGRDMQNNPEKYIGQWCEFKYMQRDRQGGYRHCTFHRLREAK